MPGEYQGALTGPQIDALPGQIAAKQPIITITGALKCDGAGNLSQAIGGDIPLADAGDYFTTKNTEAALQQLANTLSIHSHGLASQAASGFMSAADKLKLDGIDVGAKTNMKGTGTLPTSGWVAATGDYAYKFECAVAGITTSDNVLLMLDKDALDTAADCELAAANDSYAGGFTVYANAMPAAPIAYSYVVIK